MRETWMRLAQGNDVMVRFILTEEERTDATDEVISRLPCVSYALNHNL